MKTTIPLVRLDVLYKRESSTPTYMVFAIRSVEDSAQNKRHEGEVYEVDAVEVGFPLDELLHCRKGEGHPGRALARWASAGCGLTYSSLRRGGVEAMCPGNLDAQHSGGDSSGRNSAHTVNTILDGN